MRLTRLLQRLALSAASTAILIAVLEVAFRLIDGYHVASLALERSTRSAPAPVARSALPVADRLPAVAGLDRSAYDSEPPRPVRNPADPALTARAAKYPGDVASPFFSFNRRYLDQQVCTGQRPEVFGTLDDFFFFDPIEPLPFPAYRHLRHASPPGWFSTNNFGWRGHDVALRRPDNVIRIAFVGASTTVDSYGAPFSHPELVEHWLNAWATQGRRTERFEVINAGRSGIDSRSIAAVVRQEVVPVDPDLVVFYEGANQFWPGQIVRTRLGRFFMRPASTFARPPAIARYSALYGRIRRAMDRVVGGNGSEPRKPPAQVDWPAGVDEQDPDPDSARLPMDLQQVVRDLDSMRKALDGSGGELAVSSFVWLAHDGLVLDPSRHGAIFQYLNQSYWPLTYRHIRRMADFQNRVFRNYARARHVPFLDIAVDFPQDPDLFDDAIHLNYQGLKLQAWLYVRALVPVVEGRIAAGRWPRPPKTAPDEHPAFSGPDRQLVAAAAVRARCG